MIGTTFVMKTHTEWYTFGILAEDLTIQYDDQSA